MTAATQRLLHEALTATARRLPAKAVIVADGREHGYAELAADAAALAGALQRRGLRRGERVLIHLENGYACAVAIFAVLQAGGVVVPVNPQTRVDKLGFIADDCAARILVTGHAFAAAHADRLPTAVVVTVGAGRVTGCEPFAALRGEAGIAHDAGTIPTDLAALIYTSGSSGEPKGVMHSHQTMTFARDSIREYLQLREADRILNVLPLAFDYGLYQLLMAVRCGATLVLERSFAFPALLLERLAQRAISVLPGVPTLFSVLRSLHRNRPFAFPTVRCVTNTAAALPADIVAPLRAMFPNAALFAMYGLTECKRVSYLPPERIDDKPGSVGRAIPGTEALVLDAAGAPVAPGGEGVLHVRGPHVMLGYWNRPELTAHMLRPGRWPGERLLCTHDRFTVDAEGFLYFRGRGDDIIKCRGEKVSPAEVEAALYRLDGVRDAAVVGVPDPLLGEAVVAFVAAPVDAELDAARIRGHCAALLEPHLVPQRCILLDELPLTANGKVDKRALAAVATTSEGSAWASGVGE